MDLKVRIKPEGIDRFVKEFENKMNPIVQKLSKQFGGKEFDIGFKAGLGVEVDEKKLAQAFEQGGFAARLGKIIGVLTKWGAIFTFIQKGIGGILSVLQDVSPIFRSMMDLLSKAVSLMLKPIADVIGIILKPFILLFYRYVVLPFYQKVMPVILQFDKWFSQLIDKLPESGKRAIGFAVGGATLGFMFGGPVGALLGAGIGALIGFLTSIDWKPVIEAFKGLINLALKVITPFVEIARNVFGFFINVLKGDFRSAIDNLKEIGKIVWNLITTIIPASLEILYLVGSKIFEWIKEKIFAGLDILVEFGKKALGWIRDKIFEGLDILKDLGMKVLNWIGKKIIEGLDVLKDLGQKVLDWIWGKITGFWKWITGGEEKVGDVIISRHGVFRTSPEDVIIATKTPERLGSGVQIGSLNISVNANVSSDYDVRRLAELIAEEMDRNLARYSRW